MDFDAPAIAQLDAEIIKPRWYGWLDILGDPVRATTGPANVTFPSNTGDPDLNNQTFEAWHPDLVDVSEVKLQAGGGGTVTASVSGLIIDDNVLLNVIGNPLNWQGRVARFWMGVHNQANVQQGAVVPYYGGFMSSLEINGQPSVNGQSGTQAITVMIESFTASWSRGSGRTYMDQEKYDPLDLSAAAALAAANGGTGDGSGGHASGSLSEIVRGGGGILGRMLS